MNDRLLSKDKVVHIVATSTGVGEVRTNIKGLAGVPVVVTFPAEDAIPEGIPAPDAAGDTTPPAEEIASVHRIVRPDSEQDLDALKTLREEAASRLFTREIWKEDVMSGRTTAGYDDWVKAKNRGLL